MFASRSFILFVLLIAATAGLRAESQSEAQATDPAQVMRRVFDWQVGHLWSTQQPIDHRWGTRGWVHGAFLTGVMEAYRSTGDEAYLAYAQATAERNGWEVGPRLEHADDHIVGQTYLELEAMDPDPAKYAAVQRTFDALIAEAKPGRKLWWWCDALYMAPPTLAKLATVTGDARYWEALERWYWDTTAYLYDPAEQLFYRDDRFFNPEDGNKIFWSRGNGWVVAGLARLLDVLPADYPSRGRYEELYRAMATRLVALQPADGLWRADLLRGDTPHGEASGSAFFCYAIAWGLNHGLLEGASYRAAVDRAWAALQTCVAEDGHLGWVQPIGSAPDHYDATTWQEYGSGAFLAAGSQVRLLE